jgi:hypothetical protein
MRTIFLKENYGFELLMHAVLFQHFLSPQSQTFTSLLLSGEQPQDPIKHVFGKSLVDLQHS